MFIGSCFLLILSYLAVKVVLFGKVTTLGEVLRLSTIFSLIVLFLGLRPLLLHFLPLPKIFPSISLAISPKIGGPTDASSPIGIAPPFCFLFFPPNTKHLFLQTVFPCSF